MKNRYEDILFSECNHKEKGFINLLKKYNEELDIEFQNNYSIKSSIVKSHIKAYGSSKIDTKQERYFFRHLLTYFDILYEKQMSVGDNEKKLNIISSISAYLDNPFEYIYSILNSNLKTQSLIKLTTILKSERFILSFKSQVKEINYNTETYASKDLEFPSSNLKTKLYSSLNLYKSINSINQFKDAIDKICYVYEEFNQSDFKLENIKNNSNIVDSKTKADLDIKDTSTKNDPVDLTEKINEKIIDKIFNPDVQFIKDKFDMYSKFANRLNAMNTEDCRRLKTIIYGLSYVLKDTDIGSSPYVNNIVNSNVAWAVGSEYNTKPSFYGESDFAKYFSTYFSFMTGEENPYREIINNKITREMDYNAILLQKYFKDHGILEIGLGMDKLNDVYSMLKNLRELIKILDEPIVVKGVDISSFIMGIVNTIMNSATITLDFSVSRIAKELFYMKLIPINKQKYSVGDIYNYLTFIKLILKQADKKSSTMNIEYISKDEFIENAFDVLGINKNQLEKSGYGAYSRDKNHLNFNTDKEETLWFDSLYENKNGVQFILQQDMKLLYSLIQFGIQKRIYKTGDKHYEDNFSFGNEYQIKSILESLTKTEIFFIFTLYEQNMFSLKYKIEDCSYDNILDYNKNLLDITKVYDHSSKVFYEIYLSKDKQGLIEKMEYYNFKEVKYERFINSMYNEFRRILQYNKKAFENMVFSANNISDIDDFLVRFIPSIIEMLKTLGQENISIEKIVDFIDCILGFISDTLFRNLFLGVKRLIKELTKRFSGNFFENIKSQFDNIVEDLKDVNSPEMTFDLALGDSQIVRTLDKLIKFIEIGNFDLFNIQECFADSDLKYTSNGYDPFYNDNLIFNGGTNDLSGVDSNHTDNDITYNKDKVNIMFHEKNKYRPIYNNKLDDVISDSNKNRLEENKKVIYDKGEIIIEKEDGSKIVVVSKNDYANSDKSFIKYPDKVEQNLSKDEYQQLIEIRDHIDNLTNFEISNLNKQLNKLKEQLNIEMKKPMPSYNVIKNINKNIADLTSHIDDVKTKNRILTFDENNSPIIIKDFDSKVNSTETEYYNTLDSYFKNKKTVLEEVDKIVEKSPTILTNYQITELLK